ncbi:MAG: hypothetical protein DRN54_02715 [Thaumarchaeota archaeon]|nr:MAG: hypothetical protein DRN54_02715 [Nitrososphaerota archaeon]
MRIWLDILSPKQLLLFTSIAGKLREAGHSILLTSRRYVQLDGLIDSAFRDWGIVRVGEWGGGSLEGKLRASIERMRLLLDHVTSYSPDVCLSSGSPEAARIAYGLRIPHLLISDTPHSPVNKLTAPLSEKILTPWVIPLREWAEAGADRRRINRYKALDPCFWLKDFTPDERVLSELELEKKGYVLFRMPETRAAYLDARDEDFIGFLEKLKEEVAGLQIVVLSRYREQAELLKRSFGNAVKVVEKLIPGASLIAYSALFIGGGGTMTQEAALLGVPAISIYPRSPPTVLRFLERRRLVLRCSGVGELAELSRRILGDLERANASWKSKAERLWRILEDPLPIVLKEVESLA